MNNVSVMQLLDQWYHLLNTGEKASKRKAMQNTGGLIGRIQRTTGSPVIFDSDTCEKQRKIQSDLCKELPKFADLIRGEPEIMDGYAWTRKDFIELYFEHYRIVIEKLKRLIKE